MDFHKLRQANFIMSKTAAARIIGLSGFSVRQISRSNDSNTIDIKTVQGDEYQIPLAKFKQDFVDSRKFNSEGLLISSTEYGNVFIVENPENGNKYPVRYTSRGIDCKCRDFEKQQEILGKGCCKHGYRVLNHLGYNSLQSYLDSNNSVAA